MLAVTSFLALSTATSATRQPTHGAPPAAHPINLRSPPHAVSPGTPGPEGQSHAQTTGLAQSRAALRQLQQSAAAAEVAVVTTPLELLTAIATGHSHLEIRDHMDFTDLLTGGGADADEPSAVAPGAVDGSLMYLLGTLPPSLKTVRVCPAPDPSPPPRGWCYAVHHRGDTRGRVRLSDH